MRSEPLDLVKCGGQVEIRTRVKMSEMDCFFSDAGGVLLLVLMGVAGSAIPSSDLAGVSAAGSVILLMSRINIVYNKASVIQISILGLL